MAIFEFSDDFDAQGWYTEQMLKNRVAEEEEEFESFIDHEVGFDDAFDHDVAWAETYLAQWG